MKPKKVVLCGQGNVLGDGVESFLLEHKEWLVVRIEKEESAQMLKEHIEMENPDVVIVYESSSSSGETFPYQLLTGHPKLKVITLSLENNFLEVYDKHRILVNHISDLYSAINE